METGIVKFFNNSRGWGYITADEGGEFFVHFSGIEMPGYKTLIEGQRVVFEIEQGKKGPIAVNVVVEEV